MPRVKQTLTDEQTTRLRAAERSLEDAQAELRDVVRDLLNEGASIRELAAAAEISTNTVQRWKRGE
jgi:transposase-like protein